MSKASAGILLLLEENATLDTIVLKKITTIVGRERGDILLDDPEVSSSHCQIQRIAGTYHIFDLNSTNGTHLNGEKIAKSTLKPNDLIKIGKHTFKFEFLTDRRSLDVDPVNLFEPSFASDLTAAESEIAILLKEELQKLRKEKISLDVTYPSGHKEKIMSHNSRISLGRDSDVGAFNEDPRLAPKHAVIRNLYNGQFTIEDLGTGDRTQVNGKPINGIFNLSHNDLIKICDTTIKVGLK